MGKFETGTREFQKVDIYRVTEWKNGYVWKTKKIITIWCPAYPSEEEQKRLLTLYSGDIFAQTAEMLFGPYECSIDGQTEKPKLKK